MSVYVQPSRASEETAVVAESDAKLAQDGRGRGGGGGGDTAAAEGEVWRVFRGMEAVAGLALGLSPRLPRERWLQAALLRHFPETLAVLRVRGRLEGIV